VDLQIPSQARAMLLVLKRVGDAQPADAGNGPAQPHQLGPVKLVGPAENDPKLFKCWG